MFCTPLSVPLSLRASVHPILTICFRNPQYRQHLSMDFRQTFVISVFWDKGELIGFWGQKVKSQRSHYHGRGIQNSMLPLSSGF